MKRGKLLIKFDNIYLIFILSFLIYQLYTHYQNNVSVLNLIYESVVFLLPLYLGLYYILREFRVNLYTKKRESLKKTFN